LQTLYWHVNFGVLEVDWATQTLSLQVRGDDGALVLSHAVSLMP
jgi:hypothetical protein